MFHQKFKRLHIDVQPHHDATTNALDFHVHPSSSTRLLAKGSSINGTRQFHQWNSLVPSMELISPINGTRRFDYTNEDDNENENENEKIDVKIDEDSRLKLFA